MKVVRSALTSLASARISSAMPGTTVTFTSRPTESRRAAASAQSAACGTGPDEAEADGDEPVPALFLSVHAARVGLDARARPHARAASFRDAGLMTVTVRTLAASPLQSFIPDG
ncbi:MAG: hypothetical protein AUG44_20695 [Actinobacteria bacterium 13_1_20CM_3_71_11]|nr:MAG: hypothetical protein AUG44_20695 [Actinobacteria bacterium 13_1_20CM_3_71_11]